MSWPFPSPNLRPREAPDGFQYSLIFGPYVGAGWESYLALCYDGRESKGGFPHELRSLRRMVGHV